MKTKHTPTPYSRTSLTIDRKEWAKYLANDPAQALMINWDGLTGGMVAIVFGDTDAEAEATAKFMQRACNAHEELVAALQNLMNGITSGAITSNYDEVMERAVIQAHSALRKARGEA